MKIKVIIIILIAFLIFLSLELNIFSEKALPEDDEPQFEKVNYKKAGIFDKLTGTSCIGCQKK